MVEHRAIGANTIGSLEEDSDKPLGLMFHGFGASAESIQDLAAGLVPVIQDWYIPQGPVDLGPFLGTDGYAWFPEKKEELQQVFWGNYWKDLQDVDDNALQQNALAIYEELEQRKLLSRPLVLAGFSQGAMICSELLILLAQKKITVKAAVFFSGALIAKTRWQRSIETFELEKSLQHSALWQSHGLQDQVLAVEEGERLRDFWSQYTALQYYSFEGGHDIPQQCFHESLSFLRKTLG